MKNSIILYIVLLFYKIDYIATHFTMYDLFENKNILEKVIKYFEKIDEKELKNIEFSQEVINIFKERLKKEYMNGFSLVKDKVYDISDQLEIFCTKLVKIKEVNKK